VPHPVQVIGTLVSRLERRLLRATARPSAKRRAGILLVLLTVAAAVVVGGGLALALRALPGGWVLEGLAMSTLLAQRSLDAHVLAVAQGLETEGVAGGRAAVAHIVGRETKSLDEAAICRAAIESLAENFSDGVVAPLFWMVVAGLPGALAYKAINTADSMIGHRTERHEAFGWASARFDDLVNLPASRLSALWLALAAIPLRLSPAGALGTIWRDASHHRSPNAGWPEAAMAGALGIRLSGPRVYGGVRVEERWVGEGRSELSAKDIRDALKLYRTACALQIAVLLLIVFVAG
jgi:adenosylcobinamide-phosphate synthase